MTTKRTLTQILEHKYFKDIIISTIILIIAFIYFPRNLERTIGIKHISVNDISHVSLFQQIVLKKKYFKRVISLIRV